MHEYNDLCLNLIDELEAARVNVPIQYNVGTEMVEMSVCSVEPPPPKPHSELNSIIAYYYNR